MSRLTISLPTLLLATVLGGGASAQQATLTPIPSSTYGFDLTPDGSIVVGSGSGGAFYWRWKQDPAPVFIGGREATAISDDGTVITGDMDHPVTGQQVAGRWTQATGWVALSQGLLGECGSISSGYDISGDGQDLVGLGWNGCSGAAYLWTAPGALGTQELQTLGNGQNRASTISRDGSGIGGFAQGDFNRTPAVWDPATLTGTVFDMSVSGEVHGFSDDGDTVLGEWNGDAFYWPGWETDPTQQNFVNMGTLNPGWTGIPTGMAEPLTPGGAPPMIVGFDSPGFGGEGWVWTPAGGFVSLKPLLTALGVPSVPDLNFCNAVSSDGRVIVGHTFFGGAWIVEFPTPGQVSVYGCGGNPAGSMTVVSGLPEIGKTMTLGLDNPLGSQAPGSFPFVVLATAPAFGFPCGTSLPGFGMGGGAGELLIDIINPPNPILPAIAGNPWAGAGSPAPVQLNFPANPNFIGETLYGQGVLLDFSPLATVPVGLTDAVEMVIGS